MADIDHRRTLENWYSRVLTDNTQKISAVKSIFEAVGVRKACEEKVNDYTETAMAILGSFIGANPINAEWSLPLFCAVPVLPHPS